MTSDFDLQLSPTEMRQVIRQLTSFGCINDDARVGELSSFYTEPFEWDDESRVRCLRVYVAGDEDALRSLVEELARRTGAQI